MNKIGAFVKVMLSLVLFTVANSLAADGIGVYRGKTGILNGIRCVEILYFRTYFFKIKNKMTIFVMLWKKTKLKRHYIKKTITPYLQVLKKGI